MTLKDKYWSFPPQNPDKSTDFPSQKHMNDIKPAPVVVKGSYHMWSPERPSIVLLHAGAERSGQRHYEYVQLPSSIPDIKWLWE